MSHRGFFSRTAQPSRQPQNPKTPALGGQWACRRRTASRSAFAGHPSAAPEPRHYRWAASWPALSGHQRLGLRTETHAPRRSQTVTAGRPADWRGCRCWPSCRPAAAAPHASAGRRRRRRCRRPRRARRRPRTRAAAGAAARRPWRRARAPAAAARIGRAPARAPRARMGRDGADSWCHERPSGPWATRAATAAGGTDRIQMHPENERKSVEKHESGCCLRTPTKLSCFGGPSLTLPLELNNVPHADQAVCARWTHASGAPAGGGTQPCIAARASAAQAKAGGRHRVGRMLTGLGQASGTETLP